MGTYDIAQICLNGHVITDSANHNPELRREKCKKCGAATIMACQGCNLPIKGYYSVSGVMNFSYRYSKPMFCEKCGIAYPWTNAVITACKDLINLSETLTDEEKEGLITSIKSIITSDASVGVSRIKVKRTLNRVEGDLKEEIERIIAKFNP